MEIDSSQEIAILVDCCARGDQDAWDRLVRRYSSRIVCALRRSLAQAGASGDSAMLSDLVQEVYLRLLANDRRVLREFRGTTELALVTYLARVARSVALDSVRSSRARKRAANVKSLDDDEGPEKDYISELRASDDSSPERPIEEALGQARIRELFARALGGKNAARDALVFQLHVFEELTAREIAVFPGLELSVGNVETIIVRARARLRRALESRDGELDENSSRM